MLLDTERRRIVEPGKERGTVETEDLAKQNLGVQSGCFRRRVCEPTPPMAEKITY